MVAWINTIITTIVFIFGVILCGSFIAWVATVVENTLGNLSGSDHLEFELLCKIWIIICILWVAFVIHDCNLFIKVF